MSRNHYSWIGRIWLILIALSLLFPAQLFSSNCTCNPSTKPVAAQTVHSCCSKSGHQFTTPSGEPGCIGGQCASQFKFFKDCCGMTGSNAQAVEPESGQPGSYQKTLSGTALALVFHASSIHCHLFSTPFPEWPPDIKFLSPVPNSPPLRI